MFVLRPEVDWTRLRDQYRPRALACKSTIEFAGVCAEMLRSLRDLHVWLTVSGNQVPVFNRERTANANPAAFRRILGELKRAGPMEWTITPEKIGFIAIYGWNGSGLPRQFDTVLEEMGGTNTVALVLDVRLNGGGSEDLAREVAGRFLEKNFVYAYSQFRNGPNHTNLTERYSRSVQPRGPWRYEHPVVLLIGQKCMSSNESFVAMMSGGPKVTIMGDHTCGSSGNPKIIQLPLAMTVSVPRWIDYLPDGTPLDERGFVPAEQFSSGPNAFAGQHDDLLSAALQLVRKKAGG
jgi:C-terminal processing protease CtpA/Prc